MYTASGILKESDNGIKNFTSNDIRRVTEYLRTKLEVLKDSEVKSERYIFRCELLLDKLIEDIGLKQYHEE